MVADLMQPDNPGQRANIQLRTMKQWDMRDMKMYRRWADELAALIKQACGQQFVDASELTEHDLYQAWIESSTDVEGDDSVNVSQEAFCAKYTKKWQRANEILYGIVLRSISPTEHEYNKISRLYVPTMDGAGLYAYVKSKATRQSKSQQLL